MIKLQNQGIIESNRLLFSKNVLNGELRRAIREGRIADCTLDEINRSLMFFTNQDGNPVCPYSGTQLTVANLHLEHIIPITLGGGTVAENLIPACSSCNTSKNGNHMIEWYEIQPFFTIERFQKIVDYIIYSLNNKYSDSNINIEIDETSDYDPIIQTSGDIWETQEEASIKYLSKQNDKLKFDEFLFQCILKLNENGIFYNNDGQSYVDIYSDLMERGIIALSDKELNIQQNIFKQIKNIVTNKYSTILKINHKIIVQYLEQEHIDINEYLNNRFNYLKQELNINDNELGLLIENIPQIISYSHNEIIEMFSKLKQKVQPNNMYRFIINNKSLLNNNIDNILNLINKNCEMLGKHQHHYLEGLIPEYAIHDLINYHISNSIDYFKNKLYKEVLGRVIIGNSSIRNKLIKQQNIYIIVEELICTNNFDIFKNKLREKFDASVTDLEFEFKYLQIINHSEFVKNLFLERFKRNEISRTNKEIFELQRELILKCNDIKDFSKKEYNYKSQIQTIFATNSGVGTSGKGEHRFIHLSKFNDIVEDLINGKHLNSETIKNKLKRLFLENGFTEEYFEMKYQQFLNHEKIDYLINLEQIKREQIKVIYNNQLKEMITKINNIQDRKEFLSKEFRFKNKLQLLLSGNTCINERRINPANFNELIEELNKGLELDSLDFKFKLYEIFMNNGYSYEEFLEKYRNIIMNYEIINRVILMRLKEKRIQEINQSFIRDQIDKINQKNTVKELSKQEYWYLEKLRSIFVGNSNVDDKKIGSSNFTELLEMLIGGKKLEDEEIKQSFYNIFYDVCNGNQELINKKYNQYLQNDDIKIYLILEQRKRERIKEIYQEKFKYYENLILSSSNKEELLGHKLYFKADIQTVFSNNSRVNNRTINLAAFKNVTEKLILGYDIKSEEIKQELMTIFMQNGYTENDFLKKYTTFCEHPDLHIYIVLERLRRNKLEQFKTNIMGGKKK